MIEIPKDKLHYLYLTRKLSANQIAKIYNCNNITILKKLHKYGIRTRQGGVKAEINKKQLKELYLKRKLSTWRIEEILGHSRGTIYRYLKKFEIEPRDISDSHILYPRKPFSDNGIEKSYIIGFVIGDMRVRKGGSKSKTIKVDCRSTKREQLKLIKKLFVNYGHVWEGKPDGKGRIQIEAFLDDSFSFLLNPVNELEGIFRDNKKFLSFLAGFVDADGSFFISKNKPFFSIGNYDHELLGMIRNKLISMDIMASQLVKDNKLRVNSEGYYRKNYYWQLRVNRKDSILLLIKLIKKYIKHEKKLSDIQKILNNINREHTFVTNK